MPRELRCDLGHASSIQYLQRVPDSFVLVDPLDIVQTVVQVTLDQDMLETIAREPQAVTSSYPQRSNQMMRLVQLTAELAHDRLLVGADHSRHHLGRELLPFDAGDLEHLTQPRVQPPDPLADPPLDASRKAGPVQVWRCDPAPCRVAR